MIIETLKAIFERDLNRLRHEIELYNNKDAIWKTQKQIANSSGNLCLHLVGNLNTYVGKEIGQIDYDRNRPAEFLLKGIPRTTLLGQIAKTIDVVNFSLEKIDDDMLNIEYPVLVLQNKTSMGYLLIHLATHLAYHLGQINYHRRMMDV